MAGLNQTRDHLLERACDLTGGGVTREDWRRLVPDLPYEATASPSSSYPVAGQPSFNLDKFRGNSAPATAGPTP